MRMMLAHDVRGLNDETARDSRISTLCSNYLIKRTG